MGELFKVIAAVLMAIASELEFKDPEDERLSPAKKVVLLFNDMIRRTAD